MFGCRRFKITPVPQNGFSRGVPGQTRNGPGRVSFGVPEKLDLNHRVHSFLGPIASVADKTAVLHLLNHTSGLRGQWVLLR